MKIQKRYIPLNDVKLKFDSPLYLYFKSMARKKESSVCKNDCQELSPLFYMPLQNSYNVNKYSRNFVDHHLHNQWFLCPL